MTAIWALAAAIIFLSIAILTAAWWHLGRQWPDTLDEEQAAQNGRPLVGATILKFAAADADPPLGDEA